MKDLILRLIVPVITIAVVFSYSSCHTAPTSQGGAPDPQQVQKLTALANTVVSVGVAGVISKNPEVRPQLLAVAEAIEQALALPEAPPPLQLTQLISAAAGAVGGPYGSLVALAVNGGLSFYQSFYAANVNNQLDKQPAFKAILQSMSTGIRQGVSLVPASPVDFLNEVDLVLKPAR